MFGKTRSLSQDDLLDCVLYLAGLSGSTWCMASLYKEPNWSSRLEAVKYDFIQKLVDLGVSFKDKISKLKKYYREKDNFSLTDMWAALFITKIMKEIDEQTFSDLRNKQSTQDPYPIYTVIDMQSKVHGLKADTFVEITPHETGYSIAGAFVDTSSFGSQFDQGVKIKDQPEMDMLFLQGLCGSGLASLEKLLEELLHLIKQESDLMGDHASSDTKQADVHSLSAPHVDKAGKVLYALVEVNLLVLREENPSSQIKILNGLLKGNLNEEEYRKLITKSEEMKKTTVQEYTLYICNLHSCWSQTCNGIWTVIVKCLKLLTLWIWGTTYNFLYNMAELEEVSLICKVEKRRYVDAGIANNSPFLPLLRKERHIDLFVSLDFSENDPFKSLTKTQHTCKELHIDFPEIPEMSEEEKSAPKDFYVFKGQNKPTVIHIPLFNVVNCGAEIESWKRKYKTFQQPYSRDLIQELLDKAGMNIKNKKKTS